jgi:hypothetical protein
LELYWLCGVTLLSFMLIGLNVRNQTMIERKLFSVKIHTPVRAFLSNLFSGILAGILASLLISLLGIHLRFEDFIGIWLVSFLLMFFQIRYGNAVYAVAILSLLSYILQTLNIHWDKMGLQQVGEYLQEFQVENMLALSGILIIVESLLMLLQGHRYNLPVILKGQRGRLVGGYMVHRIWFVPLIPIIPAVSGGDLPFAMEWWPIFSGQAEGHNFQFFYVPLMIGFSQLFIRQLPVKAVRKTALWLALTGLLTVLLSYLAIRWSWIGILVVIVVFIGHEGLIVIRNRREANAPSFFSHSNQGVSVLAVLQGSPADDMGIQAGEIISKVNGKKVTNQKEFYAALQQNAAFCKLEVINLEGNLKFVQRSLYSGEHHLLGAILSPDEDTTAMLENRSIRLHHLLFNTNNARRKHLLPNEQQLSSNE